MLVLVRTTGKILQWRSRVVSFVSRFGRNGHFPLYVPPRTSSPHVTPWTFHLPKSETWDIPPPPKHYSRSLYVKYSISYSTVYAMKYKAASAQPYSVDRGVIGV